ncbi:hypothetical protein GCM10009765_68230 [Fodinicola feengrottensis]|uniref:DUF3071 domain-containing protein n=1 Tax=Fodinicola feengrottensis TaxID=435914 RepID=A0ABN2IPL7_9ACTN
MRPVRFVALAEDGRSLVLKDESGRMLSLAIDERVAAAIKTDRAGVAGQLAMEMESALTPRDIQARIRSGQSAEEVAKAANTPLEKILRFAGPVLQERAMIADHARRTRLRTSESGSSLSAVVDVRLAGHGVDPDAVEWDAYRRETGTWRVVASWPSGKATAYAAWDMDAARSVVSPTDQMASYLSVEKPPEILVHDEIAAELDLGDVDTQELPRMSPISVLRPRQPTPEPEPEPVPVAQPTPPPAPRQAAPTPPPVRTQPAAKAKPEHLPHTEPEPEPEPVQPEPQRAEAASGSGSRRGKPELPGWDDILFGARPHRN